jgi:hypothetical protein
MLRRIGRSALVRRALGSLIAGYLHVVRRTNRITLIPEDAYEGIAAIQPAIFTFWHGQHLMQTFFRRPQDRAHVMISRHGDGEINAIAVEKLGMNVVRGSGAQRADQIQKRGGIQALRAMLSLLEQGEHVALTADVPKISRVCGDGIITLAALSGRPIVPVAVVCARRIDFKSWDAASLGLPFGRSVIAVGAPIRVARDADAAAREAARLAVQAELDRVYAVAYGALGQRDPGAERASVAAARAAHRAATP